MWWDDDWEWRRHAAFYSWSVEPGRHRSPASLASLLPSTQESTSGSLTTAAVQHSIPHCLLIKWSVVHPIRATTDLACSVRNIMYYISASGIVVPFRQAKQFEDPHNFGFVWFCVSIPRISTFWDLKNCLGAKKCPIKACKPNSFSWSCSTVIFPLARRLRTPRSKASQVAVQTLKNG